ncbi:MAG: hypothetical protein IIW73_04770 [Clostridia bacterium]|nr:hypothetical protein [Clostridia bacterium]
MKLKIKEIAIFGVLGAIIFVSKLVMEAFPNIHIIGMLIVAITVVFRAKALYPIYVFVFLNGLFSGFPLWWIPYLYVWTVLWVFVMLIPKKTPKKALPVIYMSVAALHGFLFGILYAPSQAILFGLNFKSTIAWIVAGFPFDLIHGISNFICGVLICPIIAILRRVYLDKNV